MNFRYSKIILLLFLSVFVFSFAWILIKNSSITDLENVYIYKPEEQNKYHRKWIDFSFKTSVNDAAELLSPIRITSDNNGFFYVADMGNLTIKKLDSLGNLVQTFGKGKGRGPGEFLSIGSLQLNKKNQIWVADERNGRITIFEENGEWTIHQPKEIPYRVISLDNEIYVFRNRFNSQLYISSLDESINKMASPLLEEEGVLWSYVLEPIIIGIDESNFLRVNMHTNDFIKYNADGEIIYFWKTINQMGLKDLKIDPPKRYSDDQDVQFNEVSRSSNTPRIVHVHVTDNRIHVLTTLFENGSETVDTVDVYKLKSGNYLHSYKLPEPVFGFAITQKYIAGITRNEQVLKIWKMNFNQNGL